MKKKALQIKRISKADGNESIENFGHIDFERIGNHLGIKPGEVFQILKSGKGIQTDFNYYELVT